MYQRYKSIFFRHKTLLVSLGVVFAYSGTLAFAAGGPFAPHQTLDPNCLPTTGTCYVTNGGSPTQILYNNASGDTTGDANFTRDATTNDTQISQIDGTSLQGLSMSTTGIFGGGPAGVALGRVNQSTGEDGFTGVFYSTGFLQGIAAGVHHDNPNQIDNSQILAGNDGSGEVSIMSTSNTSGLVQSLVVADKNNVYLGYTSDNYVTDRKLFAGTTVGWSTPSAIFHLPDADGTIGQALTTDGSGGLTWKTPGGSYTIDGSLNMLVPGASFGGEGQSLAGGSDNFFSGYGSGALDSTGNANIFVGYLTGNLTSTGSGNTAFGYLAFQNNLSGNNNSMFGNSVGLNTTGSDNVFMGRGTGYQNTTGSNNVFLGSLAGENQQAVDSQVAVGFQALSGSGTPANNIGINNTALGFQAGLANTSGSQNSFLGYQAGLANTGGSGSVFVGFQSGFSNTLGVDNVFVGQNAGLNVNANDNTGIGFSANAGIVGSTFQRSVSVGNYAGLSQATAGANTFIGFSAGSQTTGGNNVFVGYEAGNANANASYSNVLIGYQSGLHTVGGNNMFLGALSGQDNTTGTFNVAVGDTAGVGSVTGSSNIFIGSDSGVNADGWIDSIALGREAQVTASNQFVIGSQNYPVDQIVMVGTGGTSCAIDVNGSACVSDQRLKTNITDLATSTLDTLVKLRTVTFKWVNTNVDTNTHIGFVAQDINQYFPELVSIGSDGYYRVNYAGTTPLIVESIRELNLKVEAITDFTNTTNNTFIQKLLTFFASEANGIGDFFANRGMFKQEICVEDQCLTKSDIETLLQEVHSQQSGSTSGTTGSVSSTTSTGGSTTTSTTGSSVTTSTTSAGGTTFTATSTTTTGTVGGTITSQNDTGTSGSTTTGSDPATTSTSGDTITTTTTSTTSSSATTSSLTTGGTSNSSATTGSTSTSGGSTEASTTASTSASNQTTTTGTTTSGGNTTTTTGGSDTSNSNTTGA